MAIKTVGVLGCGLMGAGIAQVSAAAGFKTVVFEVNEEVLKKGLGRVEKSLEDLGKKFDNFSELVKTVTVLSEKVNSLEKSRDRLIAGISVVGTGTIMLFVQQIAKVVS